MLDMILSRVLLPEPLRPTIPKNSPLRTSNDTPCSARSSRYSMRVNGWVTRSLSESIRCLGTRNDLSIPRTSITTGASAAGPPPSVDGAVSVWSAGVGMAIWKKCVRVRDAVRLTGAEANSSAGAPLDSADPRRAGGLAHDRVRLLHHQA